MPRGGIRSGAGRKSTWPSGCKHAETKLIRVPIRLAEQLLEVARRLDAGDDIFSCSIPVHCQITSFSSTGISLYGNESMTASQPLLTQMGLPIIDGSSQIVVTSGGTLLSPMKTPQLAERLGMSRGTLGNAKGKYWPKNPKGLSEWIRKRDPDDIAWSYDEQTKRYYPIRED